MEAETLAGSLTDRLAPLLHLLRQGEESAAGKVPAAVMALWSIVDPYLRADKEAWKWTSEVASRPYDPEARSGFRAHIERLLTEKPEMKRSAGEWVARHGLGFSHQGDWREVLGKGDRVIERLEMIYLLRSGWSPEEVALRNGVDFETVLRLNSSYAMAGVAGLLREQGVENWLDRLDRNDPILRRLDMVRLLRSGTPVAVIARTYHALEEYVERIHERFLKNGVLGILTEDDMDRYNALVPPNIRICTYNLHGTHDGGPLRFRHIAGELSRIDPHLGAFQEVICGAGVEDTGVQIGRWMSSITGYSYRSQFCYCHEFMEKYPEGVAICLRTPLKKVRTIDLTLLRDGLRPTMPRNALIVETEIFGRKVVLSSVHLDHNADPGVRLAQGEKLVAEVQHGNEDAYCTILAGDFNDTDASPVVTYLKSSGFVDAYRACNRTGGNTFPSGNPEARIDYIFVRGKGTVVSSGLLPDDPGLSDHAGVFAEIR